jgi:phosphomannomutase
MQSEDLARQNFEKAIKQNPSYIGVNYQLGLITEKNEQYEKAMELYKKEIALNENSAMAYQRLGFLYSNFSLDYPKSDVLQFITADGSISSARPSGTEPKLKCYLQAIGETKTAAVESLAALNKAMGQLIK